MNLRLLLALVAHAAVCFAYLRFEGRWLAAVLWTTAVLTIAIASVRSLLLGVRTEAFATTYAIVATTLFAGCGLNYVGSYYFLPTATYDYYRPPRWDFEFDGVTGATEMTSWHLEYVQKRNRVASASMSIPLISAVCATLFCLANRPTPVRPDG